MRSAVFAGLATLALLPAAAQGHASPTGLKIKYLQPSTQHPSIIGGQPVPAGQLGFVVYIRFNQNSTSYNYCTGSAITTTAILTAAHCTVDETTGAPIPASSYTVYSGNVDYTEAQQTGVAQVLTNPNYNRTLKTNDDGLLVLSSPINVPTIPIVTSGAPAAGTPAIITGWGETTGGDPGSAPTALQYAGTEIQDNSVCAQFDPQFDPASQMCVGSGDSSTCFGDSGGPLLIEGPNNQIVEDATDSFGLGTTCDVQAPQYFAPTAPQASWITSAVNQVLGREGR